MRTLITLLITLVYLPSHNFAHAAETQYFEKNLTEAGKSVGKTLDHVKVKTQEMAVQAKKDLANSYDEAKDSKEVKDWSQRIKAAATEFSSGVGKAWSELRGTND